MTTKILPSELWKIISNDVTSKDRIKLKRVCKQFNKCIVLHPYFKDFYSYKKDREKLIIFEYYKTLGSYHCYVYDEKDDYSGIFKTLHKLFCPQKELHLIPTLILDDIRLIKLQMSETCYKSIKEDFVNQRYTVVLKNIKS